LASSSIETPKLGRFHRFSADQATISVIEEKGEGLEKRKKLAAFGRLSTSTTRRKT
jgi:hypothetical protein